MMASSTRLVWLCLGLCLVWASLATSEAAKPRAGVLSPFTSSSASLLARRKQKVQAQAQVSETLKQGEACFYNLFLANADKVGLSSVTVLTDNDIVLDAVSLPLSVARSGWTVPVTAGQTITLKFDGVAHPLNEVWLTDANGNVVLYQANPASASSFSLASTSCVCSYASASSCSAGVRLRHEWRSLSYCQQQNFIQALHTLRNATDEKGESIYDGFITSHYTLGAVLVNRDILFPWHRHLIYKFENALRALGGQFSCVTLPYWDWSLDFGSENSSSVYSHFGLMKPGCMSEDFAWWYSPIKNNSCVTRRTGSAPTVAFPPLTSNQFMVTANNSYAFIFKYMSRYPHQMIHNAVSGDDGDMKTFYASSDPLFWLHHSNIDRLWALWQDCWDHDQEETVSSSSYTDLSNCQCAHLDDPLPLYDIPPRDTLKLTTYNYRYPAMFDSWHQWSSEVDQTGTQHQCKWNWFSPAEQIRDLGLSGSGSTPAQALLRPSVLTSEQLTRVAALNTKYAAEMSSSGDAASSLLATIQHECQLRPTFKHQYDLFDKDPKFGSQFNLPNMCGGELGLCRHFCHISDTGHVRDMASM